MTASNRTAARGFDISSTTVGIHAGLELCPIPNIALCTSVGLSDSYASRTTLLVSNVLKLATASIALPRTSKSSVGRLATASSACRMRSPSRESSLPFCDITAKFFSDMAADARTSAQVSFSSSLTSGRIIVRSSVSHRPLAAISRIASSSSVRHDLNIELKSNSTLSSASSMSFRTVSRLRSVGRLDHTVLSSVRPSTGRSESCRRPEYVTGFSRSVRSVRRSGSVTAMRMSGGEWFLIKWAECDAR